MKVLITGATGFVGPVLARLLHDSGHELVVLTRNSNTAQTKLPVPAKLFDWNLMKDPVPSAALEDIDAVFHLAGENVAARRWSEAQKRRIAETRFYGTRHLVQSINALPPERRPKSFISTSATGLYGDRGDEVLNEASSPGSDFLAKVCVDWEKEARNIDPSVRLCIVRTGIVLGEGGALAKMLLPFKLGLGGKLGSGRQWMSWIHVDDLARLYLHLALTANAKGPFLGTAPEAATNADFTRALGRALHRPTVATVPAFALKIAFGELSEALLGSQRCKPLATMASGFRHGFTELQSALDDVLGKKKKAS